MKIYLECIPCFLRQAVEASQMITDDLDKQENIVRKVLHECSRLDLTETSPYMGTLIHRYIKQVSGNDDPYKDIKVKFNRVAHEICDELNLDKLIEESNKPFDMAVRLAIAGNIIDFGVTSEIEESKVRDTVKSCIDAEIKFNTSNELKEAIDKAKNILYLGDNSGEIVFDKLLIKQLPRNKVTYVVKGKPVINDATMEDAKSVGMTDIVRVIDNGADVPGTLLKFSSPEFIDEFNKADLIIAKGQGNYETLSHTKDKKIFFLLKAKCPVIAKDLNCGVGDIIIKKNY
ncbi:hypothetical protein CLTEP_17460 [Clostridium tepidiprofundi DSM 19306]|uniref:Damage-control phosphatase ARMT1-like metal-binding domain-containing protein n=1 Tax=Clostridium tepidiprofundi DSM 19306 TaxID=1121338 RepID=A0A151B336_9CLOT|nr:ARMT1-like domain-containing protein [Clostridium tepidiprofundi]KYH34321.1 hypothetical protein CLTEP_17460 [Clostridium tepidiprofundi DSM 19306]